MARSDGTPPASARLRVIGAMMIRFFVSKPSIRPGANRFASATGVSLRRLTSIDQKRRDVAEKRFHDALDIAWQFRLGERFVHQLHPAIARPHVDRKSSMPHAQPRMSTLLDITLRAAEPENQ